MLAALGPCCCAGSLGRGTGTLHCDMWASVVAVLGLSSCCAWA